MLVIFLAVVAAIGWGASDYFGGDAAGHDAPVFAIVALAELIGATMMIPVLAVHGTWPPIEPGLALAAAAGVAVTIELGLIYRALGDGHAFITAPAGALGAAIAACVGLITGDPLGLITAAGLALALAGSAISSWTSPGRTGKGSSLRLAAICLASAASVAAMLICLHAAGRLDPYWATFTEHVSTALTAGLVAITRERPARRQPGRSRGRLPGRRQLPRLVVIAAAGLGGDLAYTTASGHGALSVVAAISSLYPITTITLALLLTGTRPSRLQLAGLTLALLGAVLLSTTS
jgi:drug/metabolite transporter (DMT)-like permease